MVNIRLRIITLCIVVILTVGYVDLLPKISTIQQLQTELDVLDKKQITKMAERKMASIEEDPRRSEEILNSFIRYLHYRGWYVKKLNTVTHDNIEGFVKTNFSLQIIGDFIPVMLTLFDFNLPILIQHFSIAIDNGVANLVTDMSILHIKTQRKNLTGNVGVIRESGKVFNINISPEDEMYFGVAKAPSSR